MSILTNIAKLPTISIVSSLLITISTALGCGVLPAGQAVRFPSIATSEAGARGLVQRLVMQTVFDVLERQARSALLPDAVISAILDQLTIEIGYNPMNCPLVTGPEEEHNANNMDKTYCIIAGNTMTGICTVKGDQRQKCNMPMGDMVQITAINDTHLTISVTFSTRNIIMANWTRTMWQSVVNRAVRTLASRPFGSPFFSAGVTVVGN
ncbi:hypothetical protein KIN20_017684 [Parelaphostrongylus tenuis]|uniref:Uncharacterized protein n=1 Tax=Parelaphostrongylus tenuis TaxID=148309 RepID=A0AAD5N142_PARTN|nr:hypothetical protein KIN20_017684 [Parelaphostrongylus tenuis]